jgi:hypothetical protein
MQDIVKSRKSYNNEKEQYVLKDAGISFSLRLYFFFAVGYTFLLFRWRIAELLLCRHYGFYRASLRVVFVSAVFPAAAKQLFPSR